MLNVISLPTYFRIVFISVLTPFFSISIAHAAAKVTTTYSGTSGMATIVFSPNCIGCHTYDNDYNTASDDSSVIKDRVQGIGGALMPSGGTRLDDSLIELAIAWDNDGHGISITA